MAGRQVRRRTPRRCVPRVDVCALSRVYACKSGGLPIVPLFSLTLTPTPCLRPWSVMLPPCIPSFSLPRAPGGQWSKVAYSGWKVPVSPPKTGGVRARDAADGNLADAFYGSVVQLGISDACCWVVFPHVGRRFCHACGNGIRYVGQCRTI